MGRFIGVALLLGTSMIWGLPLFLLFYAVLGSAALGVAILAALIPFQWLAFRPLWKRLR
jgi:hypothetical protein